MGYPGRWLVGDIGGCESAENSDALEEAVYMIEPIFQQRIFELVVAAV